MTDWWPPEGPPRPVWRPYTVDPLPSPAEALERPLRAFPSWYLRVTCERCGKERLVNEMHAPWRHVRLDAILRRMRHDGCGGLPGKVELLTGIDGVSSRPVRKIVLRDSECPVTLEEMLAEPQG